MASKDFNTSNYGSYPIGFRNNNPGNLRTGETWQGAVGSSGGFITFKNMDYGIRAAATVLINNITAQKNDTIAKLITKYAPPSENNTAAYIGAVAASTGMNANDVIDPTQENIISLLHAIFEHENGRAYSTKLTDEDINAGLALVSNTWLNRLKTFFAENPTAAAGGGLFILIAVALVTYYYFKGKIKLPKL